MFTSKKNSLIICVAILLFILFGIFVNRVANEPGAQNLSITTGGLGGVYYPLGTVICKILQDEIKINCDTLVSKGSVDNIERLKAGSADLGIVQADVFYKNRNDSLYTYIARLHGEVFTIIARNDSNINDIYDLIDKKVALPKLQSGSRKTTETILDKLELNTKLKLVENKDNLDALCNKEVEAVFFVVGHPVEKFYNLSKRCGPGLKFVSLGDEVISTLSTVHPYFTPALTDVSEYEESFKSIGLDALLIGSRGLNRSDIKDIKNALSKNIRKINKKHRALKYLTKNRLLSKFRL